jgi:SOS response regulatory protein OraA/RecX
MPAPRPILRIDPSKFRPGERVVITVHGAEIVLPKGFRARDLRPKGLLSDERLAELREEIATFRAEAPARRAARATERAAARPTQGTITALEPLRGGRICIRLDGDPFVTLPAERVAREGLWTGDVIDAARAATLVTAVEEESALRRIDAAIAYGPRTAEELRRRLARKGIEATPAVEAAIERRRGSGVMEPDEFAVRFATTRGEAKGKHVRQLRGELLRRGVDDESIAAAEAGFDAAAAIAVAVPKALRGLDLAEERDRRRFTTRLIGRGFSYGDAAAALARLQRPPGDEEE